MEVLHGNNSGLEKEQKTEKSPKEDMKDLIYARE
jgi:hypothetical protein